MGNNFQIEVEFKVDGASGHLYGDGFASMYFRPLIFSFS